MEVAIKTKWLVLGDIQDSSLQHSFILGSGCHDETIRRSLEQRMINHGYTKGFVLAAGHELLINIG